MMPLERTPDISGRWYIADLMQNRPFLFDLRESSAFAAALEKNADAEMEKDNCPIKACAIYIDMKGMFLTVSFNGIQDTSSIETNARHIASFFPDACPRWCSQLKDNILKNLRPLDEQDRKRINDMVTVEKVKPDESEYLSKRKSIQNEIIEKEKITAKFRIMCRTPNICRRM